jgi:hypothetical protein
MVGLLVLECEEFDVDKSLNVVVFGRVNHEGVEIPLAPWRGLWARVV